MPFCISCGKPHQVGASFCPECGAIVAQNTPTAVSSQPAVQAVVPSQSVVQSPPQQVSATSPPEERILGIIPYIKKMKLTGQETYAVVVTERRMILAQLTGEMLKQAAKEAQETGKAEGKGFLDRWGDQLRATLTYAQRYWKMPPNSILGESPGNFALENNDITKIELDEKNKGDNRIMADNWEIKIQSRMGEYKYMFQGNPEGRDMLKNVYGDRVKYHGLFFEKKIGSGRIKIGI